MIIRAKFESICPRCRTQIEAGDKVEWEPGVKARHAACPPHGSGCACAACDRVQANVRSQEAPAARLVVEDQGVYVLPDGEIVRVQVNREKTAVYPKLWVKIGGSRLTDADTVEHGEYRYLEDWQERKALGQKVAAEGRKMGLEEARQFGIRYGVCARCSRHLKDATSVAGGYGPVCIKYFQGALGEEAA